jgi:tetratricopeptide (TPR) repeat protein
MKGFESLTAPRCRLPAAVIAVAAAAAFMSCSAASGQRGHTESEILMKKGDGYYFNSRYGEALEEYSRAIEESPGTAPAYRSRGYAYLALEDHEAAERDFDRAVELAPDYGEAYLGRGMLLFRRGRYAEAIDDFDRVVELDPWDSTARYYKALACEKIGRLREAVESYRGYIHCTVPRDAAALEEARERLRDLEKRSPE